MFVSFLIAHTFGYVGIQWALDRYGGIPAALREWSITTCVDVWILIHTLLALHQTPFPFLLHPAAATLPPTKWIQSQYALEIAVKVIETAKMCLGRATAAATTEFKVMLGHHATTLVLLTTSLWVQKTHIGFLILAITNMSNLFFDAFKYGRMTDDPWVRWATTVLFWIIFYMSRVQTLAQTVVWPLITVLHALPPSHAAFFGPMVVGIYMLQVGWFYKLTRVLWRNTIQLYKTSEKRLEKEVQEDFRQLIEHLCLAHRESSIRSHVLRQEENKKDPIQRLKATNEEWMEEALSQWRECISRQLDYLSTSKES